MQCNARALNRQLAPRNKAEWPLHWTGPGPVSLSPSSSNLHTSFSLSLHVLEGEWYLEKKRHQEEEEEVASSIPMCCYVGKATKIFLCFVSALLVVGLVLGFGLAHRTWGARRAAQPVACQWPRCPPEPIYGGESGDPLPYATTPPSVPLTEPAVAAFPGVASSATTPPSVPLTEPAVAAFPGVASSTAAPPPNPLTEPAVGAVPAVASSFAAPPTTTSVPYYGPPSPFAVGPGPSSRA